MTLVKANNLVSLLRRNAKIQVFATNIRILKVNYKPLAKPVENDFVEILGLDLPVPVHAWSKFFPLYVWYEHSAWIVFWVIRRPLHRVFNVVFLGEPGPKFIFFDHRVHVLPGDTLVTHSCRAFLIFIVIGSFNQLRLSLWLPNFHYVSILPILGINLLALSLSDISSFFSDRFL